jgi:Fe-S cluster assembly protein SufD
LSAGRPAYAGGHQHLQQLLRLGLPTRKHEDWKYTPLDALLNGPLSPLSRTLTAAQRDAGAAGGRLAAGVCRRPVHRELSDDLAASGYDVSVDNERQHLPDAVQPEVFLHLTESLAPR